VIRLLPLVAFVLVAACADVGDAPVAETTNAPTAGAADSATVQPTGIAVPIDTSASRIEWTAAKVTRTHEGGFRRFAGSLYMDGERVTGADITAEAASIFSDTPRLTEHLKSDDFFDVAVNPDVRFLVDEVTQISAGDSAGTAGATHMAAGTLMMHGRTNRVSFPLTLTRNAGRVTADADFIIDRQDWGLSYPGQPDDLIDDEIRVRLHIVAPATPSDSVS
jgi:polyisoprenoid-binding protein YceI